MVDKYRNIIIESQGNVHRFEDWGVRNLAYQIQKLKNAHYVLLNLECDAAPLAEIKEDFRFNDAVLRNLIISRSGAVVSPSPMALAMKQHEKESLSVSGTQLPLAGEAEKEDAGSPGNVSEASDVISAETEKTAARKEEDVEGTVLAGEAASVVSSDNSSTKSDKNNGAQVVPGHMRQNKSLKLNDEVISDIDYKDMDFLRKFTASTGKILPRRITGIGARHQRRVALAIKLARYLVLLPFTENHRPIVAPPAVANSGRYS